MRGPKSPYSPLDSSIQELVRTSLNGNRTERVQRTRSLNASDSNENERKKEKPHPTHQAEPRRNSRGLVSASLIPPTTGRTSKVLPWAGERLG